MRKQYKLNPNCNIDIVKGETINKKLLIDLLECNSFYKLSITNNEYILVQLVQGCIINKVSSFVLKDAVFQYLEEKKKEKTKELFYNKEIFNNNLITSLHTIECKQHIGDKDTAYLYYKNGVLEIKKNHCEIIEYRHFKNYLWSEQIINREIVLPLSGDFEDFCFNKFLRNISGQTEERYNSLISIIGYLLHNFKDKSFAKAIIFTDEDVDISGISANGGKGKSVLSSALSLMANMCKKEGKNIETGNRFFFQEVEPYNGILYFDDVKQDFNFESLYSVITGDMTIEKKHKTPITIPFEESPKILISSNYIVSGKDGYTDERRRIDFEFSSYYSKNRTPLDEFGHIFFDDWTPEDWHKFDSLMIYCIQYYLNNGLIQAPKIRLQENKIIQSTHPVFFEFAESNLLQGNSYNKKDLFDKFISENQEEVGKITPILFKKWLDIYLQHYKKWKYEHCKSNGNAILRIS